MHLQARQTQRLEQRLLPQMLQSVEVLQLATTDLLALVEQELQSNEVLEALPAAERIAPGDREAGAPADGGDEWDAPWVRRTRDEVDARRAFLENQPAPVGSLLDHVRLQVAYRALPAALADAVMLLAQHLDERGLLSVPLDEIAAASGAEADLLAEALDELQSLDPRGLGAASAVEAMLLQAAGDPDFATIERILTAHLEEVARNRLPEVARALHIGVDDLQEVLRRMRSLEPAPAAPFRDEAEPTIRPDVHAWLADDGVQVALAEDVVPELTVSSAYEELLRDRSQDPGLREYLRNKVRAARDLIGAIGMRRETLLRVAAAVMRHQRDFLLQGRSALRPLRMSDVAAELGVHASTVSRAIAGKYVSTDLGTFRLRDFFDGGRDDSDGQGLGRGAIAQRIRELIDAEDRANPFSDDALVDRLRGMGVPVARRTVTKFRRELGIPSSYRRRRHVER